VHIQYHVTFKPGDTSVCKENGSSGTAVVCVFIDYLILNNIKYAFHGIYGTQTVSGVPGYAKLTVPAYAYTYASIVCLTRNRLTLRQGSVRLHHP
jgi:hypothetical protein